MKNLEFYQKVHDNFNYMIQPMVDLLVKRKGSMTFWGGSKNVRCDDPLQVYYAIQKFIIHEYAIDDNYVFNTDKIDNEESRELSNQITELKAKIDELNEQITPIQKKLNELRNSNSYKWIEENEEEIILKKLI